MFNKITVNVR